MITSFQLYLLTVVNNINVFLNIVFVSALFAAAGATIIGLNAYDTEAGLRFAKRSLFVALAVAIPLIFIPSKKDLIAIYAVPMVLQNEKIQKLPDVLLDYVIEEFSVEKKK